MLPSIIQENFLTVDEIEFIKNHVLEFGGHYDDYIQNQLHGYYKTWPYYNSKFKEIRDILDPKFQKLLNTRFVVDHSHILDSHDPYEVHTDYFQNKNYPARLKPAYTFIIPLADYDSNTVVFEQASEIKSISEYIDTTKPDPVADPMSPEFIEEYLSHVRTDILPYLSLKEVFLWQQGSIHAADRRYFPSSDTYKKRGLQGTQAFIFWTSTPI